jgi:hypothetical protein
MPIFRSGKFVTSAAVLLGGSVCASAASLAHPGPIVVQDGVYDNIVETSITDPLPMYGPPSAGLGNVMTFPMPSFVASASDNTSDLTAGALEFTFDADPGLFIGTLSVFESGAYDIVGGNGGAGGGSVSAAGALTVRYFDDLTQQFITLADPIHMVISPGGIHNPALSFPVNGSGSGSWLGAALINFADLGIKTTSVIVAMDNTLIASAAVGGTATISKDELTINTTFIPEPASLVLMGLGLVMVLKRDSHDGSPLANG